MMEAYSTLDIAKRLEIPRERLRVWIDKGFVVPSIEKARKQGTKNLFDRIDVYSISLFRHLLEKLHLPREEAAKFTHRWVEVVRDLPAKGTGYGPFTLLIFWQDQMGKIHCIYIFPAGATIPKGVADAIERLEREKKRWEYLLVVDFMKIKKEIDATLS